MNLFLDDIRHPSWVGYNDNDWIVARDCEIAKEFIRVDGVPDIISFDHDLGESNGQIADSGYDFARWLVNSDLDGDIDLHCNFTFFVHSSNPVGSKNISALLNNYLNHKRNIK